MNRRQTVALAVCGAAILVIGIEIGTLASRPSAPAKSTAEGPAVPSAQTAASQPAAPTGARPNTADVLQALFGSTRRVDVDPEVWAVLEFSYKGAPHMVAFVALKPLDAQGKPEDCHACSPVLAAVTYREEAGSWRLASADLKLGNFGGWGKPPSAFKFNELPFGPPAVVLAFEDGGSGQGYTSVSRGILRFDEAWRFLGFVQVAEDNEGSSDCNQFKDKCWRWSGEIKVSQAMTNGVPDLMVERKGTDDAGPVSKAPPKVYAFDGTSYDEKAKVDKAAAAAAERAASLVSLADLRRLAATGMKTFKPYWVNTAINGNDNFGDRLCEAVRYDGYCESGREAVTVLQDLASLDARRALYDLRGRRGNTGCAKVEMRPDAQLYLTEFSPGSCR